MDGMTKQLKQSEINIQRSINFVYNGLTNDLTNLGVKLNDAQTAQLQTMITQIIQEHGTQNNEEIKKIFAQQLKDTIGIDPTSNDGKTIISEFNDRMDGMTKKLEQSEMNIQRSINYMYNSLSNQLDNLFLNHDVKLDQNTFDALCKEIAIICANNNNNVPSDLSATLDAWLDKTITDKGQREKIINIMKEANGDIKNIVKDTNEKVTQLLKKEKETEKQPKPITPDVVNASKLYRDINTDNDYGKNSNLSTQEITNYYGTKSGHALTDYAVRKKYEEYGQINLKNENEKLSKFDNIMHDCQNKADAISKYVNNNGSGWPWQDKSLTDDDLLRLGFSGKDIKTIKEYDVSKNNGDNNGTISKEEAINAGVLGGVEFRTHTLTTDTQELFDHLGGKKNISTEKDLQTLKILGYDPKNSFEKYKIKIGDKEGVVKGDFEKFSDEIDYEAINRRINKTPKHMRKEFFKKVDLDKDGKINSKHELSLALENLDLLKVNVGENLMQKYNLKFQGYDNENMYPLGTVYDKHLPLGVDCEYDENSRTFVLEEGVKLSDFSKVDKDVYNIINDKQRFIDVGDVILNGKIVSSLFKLDDNMKSAITKTFGDCSDESIKQFEQQWQCKTQNDLYNLGALANNMICTKTLFNGHDFIPMKDFYNKTIVGFDKTGETIKLFDYIQKNHDGNIYYNTFTDKIQIGNKTFMLDGNNDGIIQGADIENFREGAKQELGEEKWKEVINRKLSFELNSLPDKQQSDKQNIINTVNTDLDDANKQLTNESNELQDKPQCEEQNISNTANIDLKDANPQHILETPQP